MASMIARTNDFQVVREKFVQYADDYFEKSQAELKTSMLEHGY